MRQYLITKKWSYTTAIFSIILSEIVSVQFPHVLGEFTDALSRGALTSVLIAHYAFELLVIGILYVLLYGVGQMLNGRSGRIFEYQLRKRLFEHWESLSTDYYQQRSIGDLLNHAMNDVRAVREALSGGANILTNAVFLLLATLYMTFTTISVQLTFISMIPILLVPVLVVWFGPKIRTASREVQEALSAMAEFTEESLSAVRLIKATASEEVEAQRFSRKVQEIVKRQMHMVKRSAIFQSSIPLLGSLSFSIALLYGGLLTVSHKILLGQFVAFTLYLAMIITPLQQIGFVINNFQRASASLARLRVLLSARPSVVDSKTAISLPHVQGAIEVKLDFFRYPNSEHKVLEGIAFSVQPGQTIGIVGRTGAGKTTLANLLLRVFDPPRGAIFIDGVDIRDVVLRDLRTAIAYVPQDGFLFSTTIAENIGFAKAEATPSELMQAAKDAMVYEEIVRFKEGMNTQIGERGVTLSGGQKQRVAIARALIKNAPIMILDDSLSAVDMNTEKMLITRLKQLRTKKTTLIIAHRLSAVFHADQILVLDEGRIVERGTHEELLQRFGIYRTLYDLQQGEQGVTV
ncbi:ABC transporter ATP-binding protein [Sulfoacidibacillus thermotolerans]|uniref:ABC transporter n=1 Tax=Sulfoacidibacillus thermotolerans TaxID=1765684 RepID=A0A2U3D6F7_SULT2|nr:ABC transporter ATP-binding protein [Sulfoacidibacillus thermotolerans]PWI56866.1 ABC transporter [Sulfoacidibacillus thermotolerans]